MNNMFYLLNVGVSGIKGIKNEVRLDFYKKTIDKKFDPEKYRIKAIYGENGSGKSALITAVKIFQDLIDNESYLAESRNQIFLNEMVNKATHEFRFYCEYLVNLEAGKVVYYYEVKLGLNNRGNFEIQYEVLKVRSGSYPNSSYSVVFEAVDGELVKISCDAKDKEMIEKKTINLLSSRSAAVAMLMAYINEYGVNNLPNEAFHYAFFSVFVFYIKVYLGEEDKHEGYLLKEYVRTLEFGEKVIPEGINSSSGVNEKKVRKNKFNEYQKRVAQLAQFIKVFKPELVSIDIDKKENGDVYECELNLNYGDYSINREFESTGIKKLIRLFDCFAAADQHGIVFVDEMDSNLNDVYLCKLLEYFKYYGKGQLCFTTHNLSPMSVLRDNKNSIDFLSSDNHLVSWTARGNATPENCYRNGMIEDSPFNVDATDFIGIFGE